MALRQGASPNCGRRDRLTHRRDKAALSTLPSHPNLSSQWKLEVNRRVAAHLNRKAPLPGEREAAPEARPAAGNRAAEAAARVAARYANAPSYSEMLAAEARAAVAAAEATSRAALEAQAAAQAVLDSIEAAASAADEPRAAALHIVSNETAEAMVEKRDREPGGAVEQRFVPQIDSRRGERLEEHFAEPAFELTPEPVRREPARPETATDVQGFAIRWVPDMPALRREPEIGHTSHAPDHATGPFEFGALDWRGAEPHGFAGEEIGVVEPAQPIFANLIEFPRELIAARKVRPRLAEGPLAAEPGAQLSIFEVDPGDVSTEPEMASAAAQAAAAPAWAEPEWSGMKLDAEPAEEHYREPEPQHAAEKIALELAPMGRRALSIVFDIALIGAAFVTAAMVAATKTAALPALRAVEVGSAVALLMVAAFYHALFFTLARATPGMRFAQIRLCTFEGQIPTRAQRTARLVALMLSVLPVGLGLAWAIFDEDHLTWHDRLSHTYLRRN
jgi:uncharacterized RDD family membrane protein YckC